MSESTAPTAIDFDPRPMIWARLTAGKGLGPYAFHQLIPEAEGQWSEGPINDQGGADPAWNFNPVDVPLPLNVRLYRMDDGSWRFQAGGC